MTLQAGSSPAGIASPPRLAARVRTPSGQASEKRRRLDELTSALQPGDRLVVSELSRLGRSLGQVVAVLDALAKAGVAFVALKENIRVEGKRDIQTKVTTTLGVSKTAIAKITGVSRTTLYSFMTTRRLRPSR